MDKNPKHAKPYETLSNLMEQQRKRGNKKVYHAGEYYLYPAKYEKPTLSLADIKDLIQTAPQLPSEKIEVQQYEKKGRCAIISMSRQQALFELLNQALWNYKQGKVNDPITFGKLRAAVRKMVSSLKKGNATHVLSMDAFRIYMSPFLQAEGSSVSEMNRKPEELMRFLQKIEAALTSGIAERDRLKSLGINKSPNKGDEHFPPLIDSLCKIWIGIFGREVGTSNTKIPTEDIVEKQKRSGPMLKFIRDVLRKACIDKSEDTIIKETRIWKQAHASGVDL